MLASALAVGLCALLAFLFLSDRFYIQSAEIEGQRYSSAREIYRAADVHGYSVFWINSRQVAERVEALPFVQRAQVQPLLPGRLRIVVWEREPIAIWHIEDRDYWVDREGITLPVVSQVEGLPVLEDRDGSTMDGKGHVKPQLVSSVLELQRLLPDVRVFGYDQINGLYFRLDGGTMVYLGRPRELARRVKLAQALYSTLSSQGQVPAEINLRYDGSFYYRPATTVSP